MKKAGIGKIRNCILSVHIKKKRIQQKKWLLVDRNLSNQLSVAEALAGC